MPHIEGGVCLSPNLNASFELLCGQMAFAAGAGWWLVVGSESFRHLCDDCHEFHKCRRCKFLNGFERHSPRHDRCVKSLLLCCSKRRKFFSGDFQVLFALLALLFGDALSGAKPPGNTRLGIHSCKMILEPRTLLRWLLKDSLRIHLGIAFCRLAAGGEGRLPLSFCAGQ